MTIFVTKMYPKKLGLIRRYEKFKFHYNTCFSRGMRQGLIQSCTELAKPTYHRHKISARVGYNNSLEWSVKISK